MIFFGKRARLIAPPPPCSIRVNNIYMLRLFLGTRLNLNKWRDPREPCQK